MRKKGFTLIELLVVIAIIAMLLAILMPALSKVKKIAQRVVCGTNLKGLGTAQTVYAHDYDGRYTVQGGRTNPNWVNQMAATAWYAPTLPWNDDSVAPNISIGTSLYLLVREADVSPKSFICPAGGENEFDGRNPDNRDLVQLWDFGLEPWNRISYAYHSPYKGNDTGVTGNTGKRSRYAADSQRSAAFAVMADKNPFFDSRLTFDGNFAGITAQNYMDRSTPLNWVDAASRYQIFAANAQPHDREGQNVLYADGHSSYESRSDVSVRNDNIYTRWNVNFGAALTNDENQWRRGALGSVYEAVPRGMEDSVLVNDKADMNNFPHQ
ncbi:MAG TPA: type II secretion system protein [Candidatus Marinimicrobia bacterium]|nr:type II secretion system protein [Candidatus Neomarinimicrobiota bacterium]